jgi:uncharacterized protein (TIGR02271 family)
MKATQIIRNDGQRGHVVERIATNAGVPYLVVVFADGSRLLVPESTLVVQQDGSYLLPLHAAGDDASDPRPTHLAREAAVPDGPLQEEIVVPVIAEEIVVEKTAVTRGSVRVHKRVETREEIVDAPLVRETVLVERVALNTLVEGAPPIVRDEGDVLIIPILEEVLVVEKRLLLKEEIRVVKQRTTVNNPQRVTLRREVIDIERSLPDDAASQGGT